MKQVLRTLSFCLAMVMLFTVLPFAAGKENETPFTDIDPNAYYYDAITRIVAKGILNGTSETTFSPDVPVTRATAIFLLYRIAGSPAVVGSSPFDDVSQTGEDDSAAVTWGYQNGITNGTEPSAFRPNVNITRQDFLTMLYRYAEKQNLERISTPSKLYFFDSKSFASYALDAIDWAKRETITNGIKIGVRTVLSPDKTMSRAELVTLLDRFIRFLDTAHPAYDTIAWDIVPSYYNADCTAYSITWHGERDTLRFAWTTNDDPAFARAVIKTPTVTNGVSDDFKYTLILNDLTPGETYRYRIGYPDSDRWETGTLHADEPDVDSFTFGVFSDTQEEAAAYPTWRACLNHFAESNPDFRFILHCGDLVEESGQESQWRDMLYNGHDVLNNTKLMLVSGNHDYWTTYTDEKTGLVADHTTIDLPAQDTATGIYYSYDVGNVHFTVLNTGDSVVFGNNGLSETQLAWLKNDLSNTNQLFKIVALHNPLYSMGDYGSAPGKNAVALTLRSQLNDLFQEYGVDLVLSGHDHISCASFPIANGTPVTDPAGYAFSAGVTTFTNPAGPIHVVTPQGGGAARKLSDYADTSGFLYAGSVPTGCGGYLSVKVEGNRLTLSNHYVNAISGKSYDGESIAILKPVQ